jgi:hypothetical protein
MLLLNELSGLWRRSLIEWPDGRRDTTSKVLWLQGLGAFGDLRQPAQLAGLPHARGLTDLTRVDCERLSEQQGFAGDLTVVENFFEWNRIIDYQPAGPFADVGSLKWDREVLIEEGRDLPYVEHWHRDLAMTADAPIGAMQLKNKRTGVTAIVVRSGAHLMYARDRTITLPKRGSLSECLAQADGIAQVHAMLDCEISLAAAVNADFRIYASTLPFRVGEIIHNLTSDEWAVQKREGPAAALDVA